MSRLNDIIQTAGYVIMTQVGEGMQTAAKANPETYTWLTGHLSAFGVSAWYTAQTLAILGKDKLFRTLTHIGIPAALTIHEFFPFVTPNDSVFDWHDIACYWAGSMAVYLGGQILDSKYNPFSGKGSRLENCLDGPQLHLE